MDLNNLQLHDGNLLNITLDPVARVVEMRISYYSNEGASERSECSLRFAGVSQFNQMIDLELMNRHATFGNISQLVLEERPGVIHLELTRGLISITAESIEILGDA